MDKDYLCQKHLGGLTFDDYLRTGTAAQQLNWRRVHEQAKLSESQQMLLKSFVRKINVIMLSGIWCGDCVAQCPLIQKIADVRPELIDIRYLDRDQHRDLQDLVRINGGDRVPVLLFCAEDYELVGWYGDRTLSRYRSLAQQQLGVSCPLPGRSVGADEMGQTVQDWMDQIERVHWILRLSGRLRSRYGD